MKVIGIIALILLCVYTLIYIMGSVAAEQRKKLMKCDKHETQEWNGEVICAPDQGGCGRVHKLVQDEPIITCPCGKVMDVDGPAMPICPGCYEEKKA